jgi:hypothetical protein
VGCTFTVANGIIVSNSVGYAYQDGSANYPYVINNVNDFNNVVNNPNSNFVMHHDVDFTGVSFMSIVLFTGTFDGAGHHISNWTYLGDGADAGGNCPVPYGGRSVGFFDEVTGVIKNVYLDNVSITSNATVLGGLIGCAHDNSGVLSNLNVSGNIQSLADVNGGLGPQGWSVGGVVGALYNATVDSSSCSAIVNGYHSYATGGIVGGDAMGNYTVTNSTFTGTVTFYWMGGEIAGGCGTGGCTFELDNDTCNGTMSFGPDGSGWGGWGAVDNCAQNGPQPQG